MLENDIDGSGSIELSEFISMLTRKEEYFRLKMTIDQKEALLTLFKSVETSLVETRGSPLWRRKHAQEVYSVSSIPTYMYLLTCTCLHVPAYMYLLTLQEDVMRKSEIIQKLESQQERHDSDAKDNPITLTLTLTLTLILTMNFKMLTLMTTVSSTLNPTVSEGY